MTCSIKIKKNLNLLFLRHVDPFVKMLHIYSHIKPLCLLQNKAITIINFSHYKASSDRIYITLDILPLQKFATHRTAVIMYKYSYSMLPQIIQVLYVTYNAVHHYSTLQSDVLHVRQVCILIIFAIKVF